MILVAGGSGTLGTRLPTLLTDRGLDVRILSRNPGKAQARVGDYLEPVDEGVDGIDVATRQAMTGVSGPPEGKDGSA